MAENENVHKGHRQRMLKKYMMQGIDCFDDHEVLEILLYLVFSRRDTNELGHRLLKLARPPRPISILWAICL